MFFRVSFHASFTLYTCLVVGFLASRSYAQELETRLVGEWSIDVSETAKLNDEAKAAMDALTLLGVEMRFSFNRDGTMEITTRVDGNAKVVKATWKTTAEKGSVLTLDFKISDRPNSKCVVEFVKDGVILIAFGAKPDLVPEMVLTRTENNRQWAK